MAELGSDFLSQCSKALKEAAKAQAHNIAYGGAESYSEYKYACGVVRGLDSALTIMEEVIARMNIEEGE